MWAILSGLLIGSKLIINSYLQNTYYAQDSTTPHDIMRDIDRKVRKKIKINNNQTNERFIVWQTVLHIIP